MDAGRLAFRTGSVAALTSFAGLDNVEAPEAAVRELGRVAAPGAGHFLTGAGTEITPAGNRESSGGTGAGAPARPRAVDWLEAAGWSVEVVDPCTARVAPTPVGVLLEGAVIDEYPKTEALVESFVLVASRGSA
jgi:hypothetical protein